MLDEPKSAPNYVYEMKPTEERYPKGYKYKGETRNTSGWNTVVVAGKIIEKIGPILAINNLEGFEKFLNVFKTITKIYKRGTHYKR